MSWILFEAISIDYKGRGVFLLVFICGASLCVVDELMQGILPGHFYMPHRTSSYNGSSPSDQVVTAHLWILCPLIILIIMHGLVLFAVAKGLAFL
ncbi:MAG: hypothetical protein MAG551_00641 [Candidatus Scalindua arabica]|uniref:Uncharacterized protein n=1 Tax=Candidatus Scalindua arabica TaxID=1127984 RepID=A0A942A449_9BACT|nr:hypothetical protein [Candidatus Scalindua arabica]